MTRGFYSKIDIKQVDIMMMRIIGQQQWKEKENKLSCKFCWKLLKIICLCPIFNGTNKTRKLESIWTDPPKEKLSIDEHSQRWHKKRSSGFFVFRPEIAVNVGGPVLGMETHHWPSLKCWSHLTVHMHGHTSLVHKSPAAFLSFVFRMEQNTSERDFQTIDRGQVSRNECVTFIQIVSICLDPRRQIRSYVN